MNVPNLTTTTTVGSKVVTTTMSYLDYYMSLLKNPIFVVRLYQTGFLLTFLLGVFGATASLMTFSRPTLRKISTGCLFITLAISDMFYLVICLFDVLEFGFQVPFYPNVPYNELCRFRVFIVSVAQFGSAWILVLVSVDRWIRTRFPFKSGNICTPKKALLAVLVVLVIDVGLHAHLLSAMFGFIIPTVNIAACGPNLFIPEYSSFYYLYWGFIQIVSNCIVPAIIMLVILFDIIISIRLRKRAVIQPNQAWQNDPNLQRQKTLQKQMFILMFTSICIFFTANVPLGIYKITSPRQTNLTDSLFQIVSIWTGLLWIQSLNYAIGFYIHCLSSTLFRKEFLQHINCRQSGHQDVVSTITNTKVEHRVQTIQKITKC